MRQTLDTSVRDCCTGGTIGLEKGIGIEFESMEAWRSFIDSENNIRIMRELRILGCCYFTAQVWAPSRYFPESLRPENK